MTQTRTENTKRNIIVSYLYAIINFAFGFISRYFIVKIFSEQYLGLSSLFSSVLQVLNMAELGFSGAVIYNMYKPLAENDTETVCALLNYYRKIYNIIGIVVLVAGIVVTPFVSKLIKGSYPSEINIYILYFLYLANTAISYFLFAYKTSLLEAAQRLDLSKLVHSIVSIAQYILQIAVLILFRNYYLFILVLVFGTAFKNVITAYICKRKFPEYTCKGVISKDTRNDIKQKVKGLLICKVSVTTFTTFDSIIISSFIGLTSVAIYNNYITVFTGVTSMIIYLRQSMQASVGNSVATECVEKNYNDIFIWQYLFSAIALWCVTCMYNLYQPFMLMWMGKKLLLKNIDVIFFCGWFSVSVIGHPFCLYLAAKGLWWEMRWQYILSTIYNIVVNIVLGKYFGITGIVFASFSANLFFTFVWQVKIIFKNYFKVSARRYIFKQFFFFILMGISCIIASMICKHIITDGILGLLIKAIICSLISITVLFTGTYKTDIFSKTVKFVKKTIHMR